MRGLLELLVPSVCPACDQPRREGEPLLCAACARDLPGAPDNSGTHAALSYRGPAARLIRRLKFEARRDGLPILVAALERSVQTLEFDVVVALPRHPRRVREEACDPVRDLARALAHLRGVPLARRILRRARPTRPQTEFAKSARARNVRGSFRATPGALSGRRALLLDDVTTTGATLAEATRALRRARPRAILPVALARTPGSDDEAVL